MDFQRVRRGLSARPSDGWPLDHLLVGVATLRTARQLLVPAWVDRNEDVRAWDIALRSGVTPQGTAVCMRRLHDLGLVRSVTPRRPWHATTYQLEVDHPFIHPLSQLFSAERRVAGRLGGPSRAGHPRISRV